MGLLKHAILPLFSLAHAGAILMALIKGKEELAKAVQYPNAEQGLNTWIERHSLGNAVAIHAALLYNDVMAVVYGHSTQRAVAATVELILFSVIAVDGYLEGEGFDISGLVFMSIIALVGLFINSKEPGIFTKDNNKAKTT